MFSKSVCAFKFALALSFGENISGVCKTRITEYPLELELELELDDLPPLLEEELEEVLPPLELDVPLPELLEDPCAPELLDDTPPEELLEEPSFPELLEEDVPPELELELCPRKVKGQQRKPSGP